MSSPGMAAPLVLQKYGTALSLGTRPLGLAQIFKVGPWRGGKERGMASTPQNFPFPHLQHLHVDSDQALLGSSPQAASSPPSESLSKRQKKYILQTDTKKKPTLVYSSQCNFTTHAGSFLTLAGITLYNRPLMNCF